MSDQQMSLDDFAQNQQPESQTQDPKIISISELNANIKKLIEGHFGTIWVKGEISNFKPHTSGHFYFSLKDDTSQISAVMFRGHNSRLKFKPENGMEVVVRGKVTVYEPRGNYQIFCEIMEPVGVGALQMAFEQLKTKLKNEGLFETKRKRPLPEAPKKIAIVTSPTGAAIRDMLNILNRRARGVEITLVPASVQGAAAPGEIIRGIQWVNDQNEYDVMIVGRGGGSIEDLWSFNDEGVARAIAGSKIPVISAVGHEIDFTISDFVADLRAPTPSAAAELVVKNAADVIQRVKDISQQMLMQQRKIIMLLDHKLKNYEKRLVDPKRKLQDFAIRCDELIQRLELALRNYLTQKLQSVEILQHKMTNPVQKIESHKKDVTQLGHRLLRSQQQTIQDSKNNLSARVALLESMNPLAVLNRGYSIVNKKAQGKDLKIVKSKTEIHQEDIVILQFADGKATALVKEIH